MIVRSGLDQSTAGNPSLAGLYAFQRCGNGHVALQASAQLSSNSCFAGDEEEAEEGIRPRCHKRDGRSAYSYVRGDSASKLAVRFSNRAEG